jgi:hypothetical protein
MISKDTPAKGLHCIHPSHYTKDPEYFGKLGILGYKPYNLPTRYRVD